MSSRLVWGTLESDFAISLYFVEPGPSHEFTASRYGRLNSFAHARSADA
jgi:hypothetical protein